MVLEKGIEPSLRENSASETEASTSSATPTAINIINISKTLLNYFIFSTKSRYGYTNHL